MPSVKEVIELVKGVGLEVRQNPARGSHTLWDIVDPSTGTILTEISGSADAQGGDPNWHWNIRRVLRYAGFRIEFDGKQKKQRGQHKTRTTAIDMDALKRAQDQARAAGVHVPTLEDLEDSTEILKRIKVGNKEEYSAEAIDLRMETFVPREETPRFNATRQRLLKMFENHSGSLERQARERFEAAGKRYTVPHGKGARSEFVRIAIEEVAPARGLRAWKTAAAGAVALGPIIDGKQASASIWMVNLIEATLDHIDGLRWEVDETRIREKPEKEKKAPAKKPKDTTPPAEPPADAEPEVPAEVDSDAYEAAVSIIDDYEKTFREILETAVGHSLTDEEWNSTTKKDAVAFEQVHELAVGMKNAADEVARQKLDINDLQEQLRLARESGAVTNVVNEGPNEIALDYAKVLLSLLENQDGKNTEMLNVILERLDKLAGI